MTENNAATEVATKLTAKETALMTAIGEFKFSFFDGGIAEESGIWTENLTSEALGKKLGVSDSARGVATVIASLGRKGLLQTIPAQGEDGPWTQLTADGAAVANKLAGNPVSTEMEEKAPKAKAVKATGTKAKANGAAPKPIEDEPLSNYPAGTKVKTKDGRKWVVVGPAQGDTTLKLKNKADGKFTFRFPRNITRY